MDIALSGVRTQPTRLASKSAQNLLALKERSYFLLMKSTSLSSSS